jgi:hypothetical protein
MSRAAALEEVVNEGKKVVGQELRNFLKGRGEEAYLTVLRSAALGARWSEIKEALESRFGGFNNKRISDILRVLTVPMLVEKRGEVYVVRGTPGRASCPPAGPGLFDLDGSFTIPDPVVNSGTQTRESSTEPDHTLRIPANHGHFRFSSLGSGHSLHPRIIFRWCSGRRQPHGLLLRLIYFFYFFSHRVKILGLETEKKELRERGGKAKESEAEEIRRYMKEYRVFSP